MSPEAEWEDGPVPIYVGRNGRLTLPAQVRSALGVQDGDQMLVWVSKDRQALRIEPSESVPRRHFWQLSADVQESIRRGETQAEAAEFVDLEPPDNSLLRKVEKRLREGQDISSDENAAEVEAP